MRLMHTADWHVGKNIRGRSRAAEYRAMLDELIETIENEQVDAVLLAGDLFDTGAPGPESEALVYNAMLRMADLTHVIGLPGNHDNPNRWRAVQAMLERAGIVMATHPAPPDRGGTVTLDTPGGELHVAMLPFVPQRNIVRAADLMELDGAKHTAKYADHVRRMLEALCGSFGSGNSVDVVLSHATVVGNAGVKLGGGEIRSHTIFTYYLPPHIFPDNGHYVALGHLHQQQEVPAATPIRYSGAPMHLDFGETPSQRGCLIIDVEPNKPATVTMKPLKAGKSLLTLRGTVDEVITQAGGIDTPTYLRVFLHEAPRPGLIDEVRSQLPDAVDIRVDNPETSTVNLEQLDAVPDDPETLFADYLDDQGITDTTVRNTFRELLDDLHTKDTDGMLDGAVGNMEDVA